LDTLMDALTRRRRMQGYDALWLPGIVLSPKRLEVAPLAWAAVGIPLLWGIRSIAVKRRALMVLLCWGVGLAVMMPWFAFNLSRFKEPSLMTAQTGAVLSAANCDTTFYGDYIGYYANCYDEYVAAGRLPEVIRLFEDLTGQKYPWGDYAQIFVEEFIFGGMENTGATTRAQLDNGVYDTYAPSPDSPNVPSPVMFT